MTKARPGQVIENEFLSGPLLATNVSTNTRASCDPPSLDDPVTSEAECRPKRVGPPSYARPNPRRHVCVCVCFAPVPPRPNIRATVSKKRGGKRTNKARRSRGKKKTNLSSQRRHPQRGSAQGGGGGADFGHCRAIEGGGENAVNDRVTSPGLEPATREVRFVGLGGVSVWAEGVFWIDVRLAPRSGNIFRGIANPALDRSRSLSDLVLCLLFFFRSSASSSSGGARRMA